MKLLARLALALLLGGCANLPRPPLDAPADWPARIETLSALAAFELEGRIAARGPVSGSANLSWRQQAGDYRLRLSGPFGAGAMLIEGNAGQATLRHRERTLVTPDPESALRAELGWTLPVENLRWWILGLPAPEATAQTEFDAQARLRSLTQDGWTLRYEEYQPARDLTPVFDLPKRLSLSRGDLSLRVLVDRWESPS